MLADMPFLFFCCIGLLGLAVGSFLNVVILRLPRMLMTAWRTDAAAVLGQPEQAPEETFNLAWPASACPHCATPIRAWQNIPVLGFILLRGRCAGCEKPISRQYPLVEIAAAGMGLVVAWHFGPTLACLLALLLSWALLALAVIDWQTQLLPDNITLPLLWLGLLAASATAFVDPVSAIIGAAAGYLVLWLVFHLFRLLTGKRGLGYGDFKLLAALGAWLGWQQLPLILVLASVSGALAGLALIASGRLRRGSTMPFGPFLAAAGWLTLVAGDTIMHAYFSLAGLI
ncbi:MAG TPA: A24 family peptidase [Salinisphaeraceae bacterium]|nr:A24 family peptidase [Salinisphaeraceae bacterium]